MGVILPSDIKKSRPQTSAMASFLGLSFYRKSKTSCEKSDNFVKTSETIVDSNVDNMEPHFFYILLISVPETIIDECNENLNLSMLIDPEVFDASIVSANDFKGDSKSEKGKLTNGQLVKIRARKTVLMLKVH